MDAFVIMDGLSLEDFSANARYQRMPSKIGRFEIARLMGAGRQFGHGPLVRFLDLVAKSVEEDTSAIHWLMVFDGDSIDEQVASKSSKTFSPLLEQNFSRHVSFVGATPGQVPWQGLIKAIEAATGGTLEAADKGDATRFLLVGFPTDGRLLALGHLLHNMLGFEAVAVCPHLVGCVNPDAHFAALQHSFPVAGIRVILDLASAAHFVGLDGDELADLALTACRIEPPEVMAQLQADQVDIIQRICMPWTRVELQPLQGGFSDSLLLLANGMKDMARTEPMVIKVDHAAQLQREIDGYHQINAYVSRQVPKFGFPLAAGEWVGVGMALASLSGRPWTLQDCFEGRYPLSENGSGPGNDYFLTLLEKSLDFLSNKLYLNTRQMAWLAPYRELRLHSEETLLWFEENASFIESYIASEGIDTAPIDFIGTRNLLAHIIANEDSVETDVCLVHGDLNYKNIIFDEASNIWFIDWTHTGVHPLEVDFAKLENDVKFVLSKHFRRDDFARMRLFEEYLVSRRLPEAADDLSGALQFVKWDLRFRNILNAVSIIRRACFALKTYERWLCYRITLLKMALHTLSFDERRGQGECEPIQLLHASISTQALVTALAGDDYHTRISGGRPSSYPKRQRIAIEQSPWQTACPEYDPPYHVDELVLENNHFDNSYGWADPESLDPSWWPLPAFEAARLDGKGRPLNPAGRTGISGRGLLGRWGVNPAVSIIIVRVESPNIEVVVGRRDGPDSLWLPRRFLVPGETAVAGIWRMIQDLTTYQVPLEQAQSSYDGLYDIQTIYDGYVSDSRETDHAWVELSAHLIRLSSDILHGSFGPTQVLGQVEWRPLNADTINEFDASSSHLARRAIRKLCREQVIEEAIAHRLLTQTGRNVQC